MEDREMDNLKRRGYYQRNRMKFKILSKRYRTSRSGKDAFRERFRKWRKSHPEKVRDRLRKTLKKLRTDVVAGYGGHCLDCGTKKDLALFKIYLTGSGPRGIRRYRKLRRSNYPKGKHWLLCRSCRKSYVFHPLSDPPFHVVKGEYDFKTEKWTLNEDQKRRLKVPAP